MRDYTPVNEPLTTARLSGLYGLCHPHGLDEATFLRLTMGAVEATATAMREIRRTRPDARLIQTEDLGHSHAPPELAYQAAYENDWRFVDLLCGRVGRDHPFQARPTSSGWITT